MILEDAKVAPALPPWIKDHIDRYRASDGREGHDFTPPNQPGRNVAALLLVTKGRKSGEKYVLPLFYGRAGDSYFVIASKGGAPDHPDWYKNLAANPDVEIQVGTKHFDAKARTATGAERQKLWDHALTYWPDYADYQKRVPNREIPVVVLDPV